MSDLLPCPFCGAGFKISQEPHDSPYVGGHFYLYHDYGLLGSAARKCPISVNSHYETKELAAAAWNSRALPAAPAEDVRAGALTVAQAAQVLNQIWPYHILEPAFDAMQAVEGEGVDTMFAAGIRALALIPETKP